jgi:hypothetical protein
MLPVVMQKEITFKKLLLGTLTRLVGAELAV